MKKLALILLCVSLTACSSLPVQEITNFFAAPTNTPALPPAPEVTSTNTATVTPTQPTPTFTSTPTLIGEKSKTPTDAVTTTPGVSLPVITATPSALAIPSQDIKGFNMITLSVNEFFIGGCEPAEVKFIAQVAQSTVVAFVVLFVRLKSAASGVTSEWTSLQMDNVGAGTFTHTLIPNEMKAVGSFEDPWVQYQLVATDANTRQVGRTQIFDEALRLKSCDLLTPSPLATP